MKLLVNGAWRETAAADLHGALQELGYADSVVGTAVNGNFVPVSLRATTFVREGDRLDIVAPMQGG